MHFSHYICVTKHSASQCLMSKANYLCTFKYKHFIHATKCYCTKTECCRCIHMQITCIGKGSKAQRFESIINGNIISVETSW